MRMHSKWWLALAFAMAAVGTANATPEVITLIPGSGPPFPIIDYWTSTTVAAAPAAPATFNQGGLCPVVSSGAAPHCGNVPVGNQGPTLNSSGLIPIITQALASGDSNYDLVVGISDVTPGYSYEITLTNVATNAVTYLGIPSSSNGNQVSIILSDALNLSPLGYALGITNTQFANQSPQLTNLDSEFQLTVTEVQAPEPASLAILGTGLGLMGLLRRYRAGA